MHSACQQSSYSQYEAYEPLKYRQYANRFERFTATLGMHLVIRQQRRPGCVQPVQFGFNPHPGLIEVHYVGCDERCFDLGQQLCLIFEGVDHAQ